MRETKARAPSPAKAPVAKKKPPAAKATAPKPGGQKKGVAPGAARGAGYGGIVDAARAPRRG